MKLAKVRFTPAPYLPDPESQDGQLSSQLLIAGKGRGEDKHGAPIRDVDIDDDAANRRVIVRAEGEPDAFVPYERVCKAWFAPEPQMGETKQAVSEVYVQNFDGVIPSKDGHACAHCGKVCADGRGLAAHVRAKHGGGK